MHTHTPLGIHWFNHDLRLDDNLALREIAGKVSHLLCVYVVDPRWFKSGHYQSAHMGQHRWAFLLQSLKDLDQQLKQVGNGLHVVYGEPVEQLSKLISESGASVLSTNSHSGVYERQQWQRLKRRFAGVIYIERPGHCLFDSSQLPFASDQLPDSFTPFRKQVESIKVDHPSKAIEYLPTCGEHVMPSWAAQLPTSTSHCDFAQGGATAAKQQLAYYLFESDLIQNYKHTRNGLDGWDFSSKLSAWLANGSLSVRQVYAQIKRYEAQRTSNESTYWLVFELLWREYFYWYALKHQHKLFRIQGVKSKKPLTSFWPQRFAKWCAGNTPYPIVNACMKQLNQTGYMSNRGRQLVASCLVHELEMDWRYGAAYFEQQLIDFDVASNYGNWQYLAGVGADPRGHRRFDLEKQARTYDPDGHFVSRWSGEVSSKQLDDVDPSDWPIFRH
ncbi:DASH family cryptochrome [Aliiglaciecola litoralis]|uniref:Cryptochrome DASH n=1 Tax=Aliiglaciecola litoralis TaxID=582857 RepID=A0ABP3WRR4_9ALTE